MPTLLRHHSINKLKSARLFSSKKETLANEAEPDFINQTDFLSAIRKNIISNSSPRNNTPSKNSQPHSNKYKQVARIICHLRDEVYSQYPHIIMPTRRMIECLVFNAFNSDITEKNRNSDEDWNSLVIETLKSLRDLTDAGLTDSGSEGFCDFTETDGVTRLFPNFELFDEWDAHKFSQTLLFHLDKELN